jgi:hypothetical protein
VFEPSNDAGLDPRIVLFGSVPWDRGRRGNDGHGTATAQPCFIFSSFATMRGWVCFEHRC